MSNEQKDPQQEKTPNGISIGTSLGIIFHNIPIGAVYDPCTRLEREIS
jgi:hypothetical protein